MGLFERWRETGHQACQCAPLIYVSPCLYVLCSALFFVCTRRLDQELHAGGYVRPSSAFSGLSIPGTTRRDTCDTESLLQPPNFGSSES